MRVDHNTNQKRVYDGGGFPAGMFWGMLVQGGATFHNNSNFVVPRGAGGWVAGIPERGIPDLGYVVVGLCAKHYTSAIAGRRVGSSQIGLHSRFSH